MTTVDEGVDRVRVGEILAKLRQRREDFGQSDLARELGVSQPYISKIETGLANYANMPLGTVQRLAKALRFELSDWPTILSGRMPERRPVVETSAILPGEGSFLTVRNLASASYPIDSAEPLDGQRVWIKARDYRDGLMLFQASGHSMSQPHGEGIEDGSILYVDTHDLQPRDGEVYVLHVHGNGNCVKRAYLQNGEFWLHSDNPAQSEHPPFQVDNADVIGRVYAYHAPLKTPGRRRQ